MREGSRERENREVKLGTLLISGAGKLLNLEQGEKFMWSGWRRRRCPQRGAINALERSERRVRVGAAATTVVYTKNITSAHMSATGGHALVMDKQTAESYAHTPGSNVVHQKRTQRPSSTKDARA